MKPIPALTAALLGVATLSGLTASPAAAQRYKERVLIIYGNDKCPTSNGEEIVVCARLEENERYRIPKELRETTDITGAGTWAKRAKSLEVAGAGGIRSCSPVGAGGATGCANQMFQQARDERAAEGRKNGIAF